MQAKQKQTDLVRQSVWNFDLFKLFLTFKTFKTFKAPKAYQPTEKRFIVIRER